MSVPSAVDAETIHRLAALSGLDLPLDRTEALVPALRTLLAVDAQIAALDLGPLPAVGLPWSENDADDSQ